MATKAKTNKWDIKIWNLTKSFLDAILLWNNVLKRYITSLVSWDCLLEFCPCISFLESLNIKSFLAEATCTDEFFCLFYYGENIKKKQQNQVQLQNRFISKWQCAKYLHLTMCKTMTYFLAIFELVNCVKYPASNRSWLFHKKHE